MDKSRLLQAIRQGSVDPFHAAKYHKDSPSPPPAPDYIGAANAQGAANVETARAQGRMNNPNVITPYGRQTVTWGTGTPVFDEAGYNAALERYNANQNEPEMIDDGSVSYRNPNFGGVAPTREQFTTTQDADQPTITQTLAPEQQRLLDAQNRIGQNLAGVAESGLGRVGTAMATPFDMSQVPNQVQSIGSDFGQQRDDVTNALLSRINPQFQRDEELNRTRLMNQGLAAGSEAWNADMDAMNRAKNDARMQAILAGGQEQTRMQNIAQQAGQLQNQARQDAITQQAYQRQLPLNELNALRTGAQVQNPQFQPYQGAQIGQTPIFQGALAQGQAGQNIYNQQAAAANSFNSGLMNMLGTAGGIYAGKMF